MAREKRPFPQGKVHLAAQKASRPGKKHYRSRSKIYHTRRKR